MQRITRIVNGVLENRHFKEVILLRLGHRIEPPFGVSEEVSKYVGCRRLPAFVPAFLRRTEHPLFSQAASPLAGPWPRLFAGCSPPGEPNPQVFGLSEAWNTTLILVLPVPTACRPLCPPIEIRRKKDT